MGVVILAMLSVAMEVVLGLAVLLEDACMESIGGYEGMDEDVDCESC